MRVAVYTGGKVSKPKDASVAVARIEGLPEGPVVVNSIHRPRHPTPNSVAMTALALGIGTAIAKGATELEVYASSKNALRAVDGTGGAKYETRQDALCAAWVLHWTHDRAEAATFTHRAAAEMPEVADHAAARLKDVEAALAPSGA